MLLNLFIYIELNNNCHVWGILLLVLVQLVPVDVDMQCCRNLNLSQRTYSNFASGFEGRYLLERQSQ